MTIEKTTSGTPIDFRTRPEEVPQFLSCGHNAHWVIWHSIAQGEPCILCRAEEVERDLVDLIRKERLRLVPLFCSRCREGKNELIKDSMGQYCHRDKPGTYLDDCPARPLHELLETPVAVYLKDED